MAEVPSGQMRDQRQMRREPSLGAAPLRLGSPVFCIPSGISMGGISDWLRRYGWEGVEGLSSGGRRARSSNDCVSSPSRPTGACPRLLDGLQ
jgi:hypothetical protein